jgi:hypothetical protein
MWVELNFKDYVPPQPTDDTHRLFSCISSAPRLQSFVILTDGIPRYAWDTDAFYRGLRDALKRHNGRTINRLHMPVGYNRAVPPEMLHVIAALKGIGDLRVEAMDLYAADGALPSLRAKQLSLGTVNGRNVKATSFLWEVLPRMLMDPVIEVLGVHLESPGRRRGGYAAVRSRDLGQTPSRKVALFLDECPRGTASISTVCQFVHNAQQVNCWITGRYNMTQRSNVRGLTRLLMGLQAVVHNVGIVRCILSSAAETDAEALGLLMQSLLRQRRRGLDLTRLHFLLDVSGQSSSPPDPAAAYRADVLKAMMICHSPEPDREDIAEWVQTRVHIVCGQSGTQGRRSGLSATIQSGRSSTTGWRCMGCRLCGHTTQSTKSTVPVNVSHAPMCCRVHWTTNPKPEPIRLQTRTNREGPSYHKKRHTCKQSMDRRHGFL